MSSLTSSLRSSLPPSNSRSRIHLRLAQEHQDWELQALSEAVRGDRFDRGELDEDWSAG